MSKVPSDLVLAIHRLADAIERSVDVVSELGLLVKSRYTRSQQPDDHVDEETMSTMLDISSRSLADQRRQGKLPGCWIKNGKQIRWHVERTLAAWNEGIS